MNWVDLWIESCDTPGYPGGYFEDEVASPHSKNTFLQCTLFHKDDQLFEEDPNIDNCQALYSAIRPCSDKGPFECQSWGRTGSPSLAPYEMVKYPDYVLPTSFQPVGTEPTQLEDTASSTTLTILANDQSQNKKKYVPYDRLEVHSKRASLSFFMVGALLILSIGGLAVFFAMKIPGRNKNGHRDASYRDIPQDHEAAIVELSQQSMT
jgi:hypothetical protein